MTDVDTPTTGGLDLGAVGRSAPPFEHEWTSRDAMLYAVGVGAGQADPGAELAFTTENSEGVPQRVLPTFAVVLGLSGLPPIGKVSLAQILHAEQGVTLHREIPVSGRTRATTTVSGIYDKGKGALVTLDTEIRTVEDDVLLASLASGMFVRGAGGFGGDRGPSFDWIAPERKPDEARSYVTSPGQALVYRLSGDRNPLHSDPTMAQAVGFPRPILHGLCTYGFTGRALLDAICQGNPARFGSMTARFSAPALPGQRLEVSIWRDDRGAQFRTSTEAGMVLDHGTFATAELDPRVS
jgi:acyl dehydratase